MKESELAEMLRNNPELRIEGDMIASVDRRTGSNTNAAYVPYVRLTEHAMQEAVIAECDRRSVTDAKYGYIYAIPNGQYRQGQRMEPGLRSGVPDLFLPVARRGYHGFYVELKCGDNKPSESQQEWIHILSAEGYFCTVVWNDASEVINLIQWYLES